MKRQTIINFSKTIGLSMALIVNFTVQEASAQSKSKPKYIVIQNIATEKTRVYEICYTTPGCAHKMVFETVMLAGKRNEENQQTILGTYRISQWVKFYQDNAKNYPSWYDPALPMPPEAGKAATKWFKDKYMPNGGEMRGAFGWYAALAEPNAFGQWMHGTIGWGSDEDKFINRAKKGFFSLFADLRSHGCTRHENRAIAYLNYLVPAGTPLIKVYAAEVADDPSLSRYADQQAQLLWNFALTRDQVRSSKAASIEYSVTMGRIAKGEIKQEDILEQGSYLVDRVPTVNGFTGKSAKSGLSGDVYEIGRENFRGTYSVDTGRFANYVHPTQLNVGGDQSLLSLPDIVKTK